MKIGAGSVARIFCTLALVLGSASGVSQARADEIGDSSLAANTIENHILPADEYPLVDGSSGFSDAELQDKFQEEERYGQLQNEQH